MFTNLPTTSQEWTVWRVSDKYWTTNVQQYWTNNVQQYWTNNVQYNLDQQYPIETLNKLGLNMRDEHIVRVVYWDMHVCICVYIYKRDVIFCSFFILSLICF